MCGYLLEGSCTTPRGKDEKATEAKYYAGLRKLSAFPGECWI